MRFFLQHCLLYGLAYQREQISHDFEMPLVTIVHKGLHYKILRSTF